MIRTSPTSIYMCLLRRSYGRLFYDFPIAAQLLFVVIAIIVSYVLIEVVLAQTILNYTISIVVFVVFGRWGCRIKPSELILLKNLNVSVLSVTALKCLLLAVPFFLLDLITGILVATIGLTTVIGLLLCEIKYSGLFMRLKKNRFSFCLPFASAYKWIAACRSEALLVELFVLILYAVALKIGNLNMACVMAGLSICVPSFVACYELSDSKAFLRIYKSTKLLMWQKFTETVLFSSIPLILCFTAICCVFPSDIELLIYLFVGFLYINLLMMYTSYLFFPNILMALIWNFILLILSVVFVVIFSRISIVLFIILLVSLHYLSIQNLKTIHDANI